MTGISQEVGDFSEQVWGVSMSVVNVVVSPLTTLYNSSRVILAEQAGLNKLTA